MLNNYCQLQCLRPYSLRKYHLITNDLMVKYVMCYPKLLQLDHVNETGLRLTLYTRRSATGTVKNIVKVQVCNLRLIDNIEQIGHSDAKIEWSSDEDQN